MTILFATNSNIVMLKVSQHIFGSHLSSVFKLGIEPSAGHDLYLCSGTDAEHNTVQYDSLRD